MAAISALGCIVCRIHYGVYTEASPHHCFGRTRDGAHYLTIPLCGRHHQIPGEGYETRHHNKARFESTYGTEEELWNHAQDLVYKLDQRWPR